MSQNKGCALLLLLLLCVVLIHTAEARRRRKRHKDENFFRQQRLKKEETKIKASAKEELQMLEEYGLTSAKNSETIVEFKDGLLSENLSKFKSKKDPCNAKYGVKQFFVSPDVEDRDLNTCSQRSPCSFATAFAKASKFKKAVLNLIVPLAGEEVENVNTSFRMNPLNLPFVVKNKLCIKAWIDNPKQRKVHTTSALQLPRLFVDGIDVENSLFHFGSKNSILSISNVVLDMTNNTDFVARVDMSGSFVSLNHVKLIDANGISCTNSCSIWIRNCQFIDGLRAVELRSGYHQLRIENTHFSRPTNIGKSTEFQSLIYGTVSNAVIHNVTFFNFSNHYCESLIRLVGDNIIIHQSTFSNLTILNVLFESCFVMALQGANNYFVSNRVIHNQVLKMPFLLASGQLIMSHSVVEHNQLTEPILQVVKIDSKIRFLKCMVFVLHCILKYNTDNSTKNMFEGLVYASSATPAAIIGNIFMHNDNTAVNLYRSSYYIFNNTFYQNSGKNGGAIGFLDSGVFSMAKISNNSFVNNNAEYGGALYFKGNSFANFSGNVYRNNSAKFDGGAVAMYIDYALQLDMNGSTKRHTTIHFANDLFFNNTCSKRGSALHFNTFINSIRIVNSRFFNNTVNRNLAFEVARNQGTLFIIGGKVTLTEVVIANNTAPDSPGMLCIANVFAMNNSIVAYNTATAKLGTGGLNLKQRFKEVNPKPFNLTNIQIIGNTGDTGGGLFFNQKTLLTNVVLQENNATKGSDIYCKANFIAKNVTLSDSKGKFSSIAFDTPNFKLEPIVNQLKFKNIATSNQFYAQLSKNKIKKFLKVNPNYTQLVQNAQSTISTPPLYLLKSDTPETIFPGKEYDITLNLKSGTNSTIDAALFNIALNISFLNYTFNSSITTDGKLVISGFRIETTRLPSNTIGNASFIVIENDFGLKYTLEKNSIQLVECEYDSFAFPIGYIKKIIDAQNGEWTCVPSRCPTYNYVTFLTLLLCFGIGCLVVLFVYGVSLMISLISLIRKKLQSTKRFFWQRFLVYGLEFATLITLTLSVILLVIREYLFVNYFSDDSYYIWLEHIAYLLIISTVLINFMCNITIQVFLLQVCNSLHSTGKILMSVYGVLFGIVLLFGSICCLSLYFGLFYGIKFESDQLTSKYYFNMILNVSVVIGMISYLISVPCLIIYYIQLHKASQKEELEKKDFASFIFSPLFILLCNVITPLSLLIYYSLPSCKIISLCALLIAVHLIKLLYPLTILQMKKIPQKEAAVEGESEESMHKRLLHESVDINSIVEMTDLESFFPHAYILDLEELNYMEKIGSGTQGDVYKGEYKGFTVAIKSFKSASFGNALDVKNFYTEAAALLNYSNHINIVRLIGICKDDERGVVNLVVEYLEKGSLASIISTLEPALTIEQKVNILYGIANGMMYLHSKSVIHRDLKCENILLDNSFVAKIIDFGFAKYVTAEKKRTENMTIGVGTAGFTAPEVILNAMNEKSYDERCDVYSFAMIMYCVLCDTIKPYGNQVNDMEVMAKVMNGIRNGKEFRPPVDVIGLERLEEQNYKWLTDLMKLCWELKASDRPSFKEICETFKQKM